jgi:hypothetical protein
VLPLPLQSSRRTSTERLVNCFARPRDTADGKGPMSIVRAPGIRELTKPGEVGRGIFHDRGQIYAVVDDVLWRIFDDGNAVAYGSIPGTNRVQFSQTTNGIALVAEPTLYVAEGGAAQPVTDPDLPAVSSVTQLDNIVVVSERDSDTIYATPVATPTSFNALAFAQAEANADPIRRIINNQRQIVVAGTETIELWYNAGNNNFPFERTPNGVIELGCHSGPTLQPLDNSVFWLASDLTVRRLDGITPLKVSTSGVEDAWRRLKQTDDALGYQFTYAGHLQYFLHFPADGQTWCYDATTRAWHERQTIDRTGWKVIDSCAKGSNVYVLTDDGRVGIVDISIFTEFGEPQIMQWTYPTVYANGRLAYHRALEIVVKAGVGLVTGQGSDPQLILEISDDGGQSFSPHDTASLGNLGNRETRVRFTRLGSSADRVYRCSVSDPVDMTVLGTMLDVDGGFV